MAIKNKINLSVVIIAKNEEKKLPDCLDSLKWVNEILLVDDHSTDLTVNIARNFGARVIKARDSIRRNYSHLRNLGLEESRGIWVLYVDADEIVTSALRKEIEKKLKKDVENVAFAIPRKNIILGKELKHGGWWPDYVKRLFNKNKI